MSVRIALHERASKVKAAVREKQLSDTPPAAAAADNMSYSHKHSAHIYTHLDSLLMNMVISNIVTFWVLNAARW
jgi:hypothetical protein